jgi:HSP90 family molecular chaperone
MIEESEQSRRMTEMQKQLERMGQSGLGDDLFKRERTLVINEDSALIDALAREAIQNANDEPDTGFHVAAYLYDLARLGQNDLHGSELLHFMKQSAELAADLASTKFDTGGEI